MQMKNLFKQLKLAIPASLFIILMALSYACETEDPETCEENEEICVELVTICASSSEEYYIISGDTIYCEAVEHCETAEDELIIKCTPIASAKEELEIRQQLSSIMNDVRSMTF